MIQHEIPAVYDKNSKILILGSFPSVKSREAHFFYGHPQNRFWRILGNLFGESVEPSAEKKKAFLLRNHVAVWDVIGSCDITGSSDSSVKNVIPNDLSPILNTANIRAVFCNGNLSYSLYQKYLEKQIGIKATKLPSTSPANATWSPERLTEEWSIILKYIK